MRQSGRSASVDRSGGLTVHRTSIGIAKNTSYADWFAHLDTTND